MANYSNPANITGFDAAFDYSGTVVNASLGMDVFAPLLLLLVFMGLYVVGSKYTQERALTYATFMTFIVSFLMMSGHYLKPEWALVCLLAFLAAAFLVNRVA